MHTLLHWNQKKKQQQPNKTSDTADNDDYSKAKDALTKYLSPQKNVDFEVDTLRRAHQIQG